MFSFQAAAGSFAVAVTVPSKSNRTASKFFRVTLGNEVIAHSAGPHASWSSFAVFHAHGLRFPRTFAPDHRMSAGWPVAARTLLQSIPSGSIFLRSVTARDMGTCVNW